MREGVRREGWMREGVRREGWMGEGVRREGITRCSSFFFVGSEVKLIAHAP